MVLSNGLATCRFGGAKQLRDQLGEIIAAMSARRMFGHQLASGAVSKSTRPARPLPP